MSFRSTSTCSKPAAQLIADKTVLPLPVVVMLVWATAQSIMEENRGHMRSAGTVSAHARPVCAEACCGRCNGTRCPRTPCSIHAMAHRIETAASHDTSDLFSTPLQCSPQTIALRRCHVKASLARLGRRLTCTVASQARTMISHASRPPNAPSHTPRVQVPSVPLHEKPTDRDFATISPKGLCRSWRCVFAQPQARTEPHRPKRPRPHPLALQRDAEQLSLDAVHAASSRPLTRSKARSLLQESQESQCTASAAGECATPGDTVDHACDSSVPLESPALECPASAAAAQESAASAAPVPTHRRIPWLRSRSRKEP